MAKPAFELGREVVVRLWLHRQGLAAPRGTVKLDRRVLTEHLERTGALQLDSVNVVDRAHYLTLWSRFGAYDRRALDRWFYSEREAYEYWGHEASLLPISHLPLGLRRMRRFPRPSWTERAWWSHWETSTASKRRVLKRLREQGPVEAVDFERRPDEPAREGPAWWAMPLPKEDKRSLKLLWHQGRVAVTERRHFRCVYDLAERVYPRVEPASTRELEDHWLLVGLSGNGVASEGHLRGYFTTPTLSAADRQRVIRRNVAAGRVVEGRVEGVRGSCYARPEDLEALGEAPPAEGTTLICPFDSLLWQRRRAEELLGFSYRLEIYVPPAKREFGYYAMPILHDGRLAGRLDPKLHRERGELEVKRLELTSGASRGRRLEQGLVAALDSLACFVGAERVTLPAAWRRIL
ncbi:MAG: winged helix-turn-helix domain-containing protein [Thermoanaerobaculia bacterium]